MATQVASPQPSFDPAFARSVESFYTRGATVGSGTGGDVSVWRDNATQSPVAIKLLRKWSVRLEAGPEQRRRDRQEMRTSHEAEVSILATLDHPNVIRMVEVAKMMDALYMVMECAHHDLQGLMEAARANHHMRWSRAVLKGYAVQLMRGVAYLHERNVLHRDLKPGNVLVSRDGVVKVGDFGLACRDEENAYSRWNPVVVTLWYRAPELLLEQRYYEGRPMDVWALGCILAEMLLGGLPLFPANGIAHARSLGIAPVEAECRHQLALIWAVAGTPVENGWPEATTLPLWNDRGSTTALGQPIARNLTQTFTRRGNARRDFFTEGAIDLLDGLLALKPSARLGAAQAATHAYFVSEAPSPHPPALLPQYATSYFAGYANNNNDNGKSEKRQRQ